MDPVGTQQWDAQGNPIPSSSPSSAAQPSAWDANGNPIHATSGGSGGSATNGGFVPVRPSFDLNALTENSAGEGTFHMTGPGGRVAAIPYSRVQTSAMPSGFKFTDMGEGKRYYDALQADPKTANEGEGTGVIGWLHSHGGDLTAGALKHGAQTLEGIHKIGQNIDQYFGHPAGTGGNALDQKIAETAAMPDINRTQQIGGAGEEMGEFYLGEGLLGRIKSLLGFAPKLAEAAKIEQEIQKGTATGQIIKQALAQGAKQGTVAGAQTLAKTGGDVGAAVTSGLTTGLISTGAGAVAGRYGQALRESTPGKAVIEGQEFETPAAKNMPKPSKNQAAGQEAIKTTAQRTAARHLEELNESRREPASPPALPARTGPFKFTLSAGESLPPTGTTGEISPKPEPIPRTHTGRPANPQPGQTEYGRIGTEPEYIRPQGVNEAGETTGGDSVAERTGRSHVERRVPGYMHPAPGTPGASDVFPAPLAVVTEDPLQARAHLDRLERSIADPGFAELPPERQKLLTDQRADVQRQLRDYHEQILGPMMRHGQAQLPEIDIPSMVGKVGSHTDAANLVMKQATDGYQHIMDSLAFTGESPERLTMVRNAYQAAEAKYMAAETPEAMRAAEQDIEQTHQQLGEMVKGIPNAISLKEFSALNDAYRNGLGLQKIGRAVDGAFMGNTASDAKIAGSYTGFNGARMQRNLDTVVRTMGRGTVERLIGKDSLDTLFNVAQANTTNEGRKAWGIALTAIKKNLVAMHVGPMATGGLVSRMAGLPWEVGAVSGWMAGAGMQRLNNLIVSNPRLAKLVLYGIDYVGKPEKYAPYVAQTVRKLVEDSDNTRREQNGQAR